MPETVTASARVLAGEGGAFCPQMWSDVPTFLRTGHTNYHRYSRIDPAIVGIVFMEGVGTRFANVCETCFDAMTSTI